LARLADSDLAKFNDLGLKKVELFTFKSADGVTELHGMLHFPSGFDPSKKYPVIVSVYGGPETNGASENFTTPNPMTEYGFLVASFDLRSEIDDMAAGVKSLWNRPYVNKDKVGVYGTSYGGTASAAGILRYPDVFHAACANSGVMDFRNYDNIYAERHAGLLEDHLADYDAGTLGNYAANLKGHLMIYYGTSDNNVHPANSLQLIAALQKAGKSHEVQVGPDRGHTALNSERMMEFFIEYLVMR
jgi:dipeptidyl-peptidase-4